MSLTPSSARRLRPAQACLLAACLLTATLLPAQSPAPDAPQPPSTPAQATLLIAPSSVSHHRQIQASNAYLAATRQMEKHRPDRALPLFQRAARLNPADSRYPLAAAVAKQAIITAMVRRATALQADGNNAQANAILADASRLDPANQLVLEHMQPAPEPEVQLVARPTYAGRISHLEGPLELAPKDVKRSYHFRLDSHQLLLGIFKDFGLTLQFNPDVPTVSIRLDIDNVDFPHLLPILEQLTNTFIVPVQPTSALAVKNTTENHELYEHLTEETVYLSGYSNDQLNEVTSMLRDVLGIERITNNSATSTLTLRASPSLLRAANLELDDLLQGSTELLLEMKIYSLDRTRTTNTGLNITNTVSAFNLYTQAQQIISQYQTQIQALIANGTIPASTTPLQILAYLFSSGALSSNSLLNGALGTFGYGLTWSALSASTLPSFNLGLNASQAQHLDQVQLRTADGKAATFRSGTKYPIVTSSYSSGGISSSLLSSLSSAQLAALGYTAATAAAAAQSVTIPQVQYEDLGLTLKATPTLLRSNQVQLKLDLKMEGLGGSSLNGNPILTSRDLASTITLLEGQSAVLVSNLSRQESRALSGNPGLSEIPGFQDISDINGDRDSSELIILLTPHIVRRGHNGLSGPAIALPGSANRQSGRDE